MSATDASDFGPIEVIGLTALVVGFLFFAQPVSGDVGGISLNWIAIAIVLIGGIVGALGA